MSDVGRDEDERRAGSFNFPPLIGRIATKAGPIFNFLFWHFCCHIYSGNVGVDKPVISGLMDGLPAQSSGLQKGDVIEKITTDMLILQRFVHYLFLHQGKDITLSVKREMK